MHDTALILTLTGGLTAALALGFVTQRLGLSPIVGYLLAGLLVGPYTPGFVADRALANQLAEFGVILLMFGVGLHFRIEDLLAVKKVAVLGAICQSTVATVLGTLAARAFGWSWLAGAVYGLAISVAAPWFSPACWPTTTSSIPAPAGSPSDGWWWKTSSPFWCWCSSRP